MASKDLADDCGLKGKKAAGSDAAHEHEAIRSAKEEMSFRDLERNS
jgi:hypothetical protein